MIEEKEFDLGLAVQYYEDIKIIAEAARQAAKEAGLEDWESEKYRNRLSRFLRSGSYQVEDIATPVKLNHSAKVLLFDLETSPLLVRMWSLWQNGVNPDDVVEDWTLLCFSAKWLHSTEMLTFKLTEEELIARDDKRMIKQLWDVLDEADIVIAHNAKRFDVKKSNSKFLQHNLYLPSPYQVIDTLEHAKRNFKITSNRLDYIAKTLGFEGKMSTPKGLWADVMNNNYDKLETMSEYCDQDIRVLEDVYLALRPYMRSHPNVGMFTAEDISSCAACGSTELETVLGKHRTAIGEFEVFRCKSCQSLSQSRKNIRANKNLLKSTPR